MVRALINLLEDDAGASAAEYALILAIVGAALALAALFLGEAVGGSINRAGTCIESAGDSC